MAVDIEGFDIVFSSANANHAREIDQSIARMSEKVPTLSMGISEMAKALDALGKINVDGVKKNLDAVKNSIEGIDGSKLNKVFELATAKSEGLLNSVTALVNMLGKVDMSSFRGGGKVEVYDKRSRVTTSKDTGGESQNQEQINALIRQREDEMQRLINLQNAYNSATATEMESLLRIKQLEEDIIELKKKREQASKDASNGSAKVENIATAERNLQEAIIDKEKARLAVEKARLDYVKNRAELEKRAADYLKQFDDARSKFVGRKEIGDAGRFEGVTSFESIISELEKISSKKGEVKSALKEIEAAVASFFEYSKKSPSDTIGIGNFYEQLEDLRYKVKSKQTGGLIDNRELSDTEVKELSLKLNLYEALLPIVDRYKSAIESIKDYRNFPTADTHLKEQEKLLEEATGKVERYKKELEEAKEGDAGRQSLLDKERKAIADVTNAENELAKARQANATAKNEKERALSELGEDKGEKRLAELKAETAELEKQKNLAVKKDSTTSREVAIPMKFDDKTILSEIKNISDRLATLFKDIPVSLKKELDLTFFAEKSSELKKMFDGITIPVVGQSVPKELSIDNKKIEEASNLVEDLQTAFSVLAEKIEKTGTSSSTVFGNMHNYLSTLIDDIAVLQQTVNAIDANNVKLPNPKNAQAFIPNDEYFTTRETGGEYQNQDALIRQREVEMQRLLDLQNAMNQASANQLATEEKLRDVASDKVKEVLSIEQINSSLENKKAKIREIEDAQRGYNDAVSEEAQLQKKIETLRKEVSNSSDSMKKSDRLRQELKIEEEVWGNAEKILSTERERNVVTAEYEAIKNRQADSEAARMKQLEATMKKYQAEYDKFATYEQEAFGGNGSPISQYWQDAIQQDKKGVIAFLKAREEYQRRIDANKPELGLDRSSYVAPSVDGYLNELDAINKKIKEVKEQYNETVKDLDKLNQSEEIASHAQNRDAQLKELEAKKAIIKQLTEEYGEVARAKERAESVTEVSKSELDSAKKQQSLKQELETLDAKIGKVDELRQKERTLADAEETLMSAIRDKKRYEEQLGTDKGESRLAALRAEHEELTKHKADIEAKATAEQKLNEQLDAEKKALEQAKQAFEQAGGEKRLAELKAETAELEKQKSLASQAVMPSSDTLTVSNEKEQKVRENINLLKKEEEALMQRRIELQNIINAADSKGADIQQRTNEIIERQNRTQQQSVVATNETFKSLELVIQEYKKAENELEKMPGKLNIAYPEDGFDLGNSVQAMKNRLQNLMSELQASVNSEENATGILSGIKFPTEQLRADFEALLKDLRGEASAYFGNLFDNEKTKVGRGYGNTEKSVEIIDPKTESDTRAWLVDAENRLERLYGLLEAIRANGNQSFFVGLQDDITNISALSEKINMLDAQIEAIEHIDKELPTTGDYGDELTHRLEQLRNMRELIEQIKDAQSDDTKDSGESLFVMNENQLKERLEKQKQAVIEAEREVQKQVGTDREEAAKRELENRKKILSDTQLAVDSIGLLGDKNEQKNAENLLDTHKRIKEQIEQRIDSINKEIAALEKEADALSVQGVSTTSDDVTIALEKERQLEQDIARFKQEAIDQDVKHKELLERIVSLKEKQGSLMDMSKTKNEFQDIRTLQELIIKESKKIGVEGIGGQFQFSDSQRRQLEEQIAKIFKTSTIEAEKMIRGAVTGSGDLMSGVWGKQNDTFYASFQTNEENIKRLQQERKQVTQELTQVEQQNEQAVLAKQAADRSAIATEEQLIKARENRLKIEKELAKQQPNQSEPKAAPSTSQGSVIQVKVDDKTILSEIKNISDQLVALFKDIPVSLKKELDLTFFEEKASELKRMFDGITVTGIQTTPAKKTENTVSTPKLDAGISQFSADSALIIEAAFERMNNLTNALIEKIRSIGTAENEMFSNLRTDIQGVSTSLQGLVDQLSKVQEKSTRKKSAKKDDDAIVTEREVALTKEELARLDDLNSKLAKSNDLLAKKRAEQDAIVKASGTRDMFIDEEISRLETEIKAYNKAKHDLLVPKHGVAPSQSVAETQQAENAQLKLVKEVEEEANARQKNIAYLTQMISLIERMLKYGNFGQGVDMFSGMQQYFVDVQAKMKSLLKEQRTTTEQQIAQQNKATEDMALSYLKMINVQIEAAKRKEREEQAYRERVLAAERAFYQERQKLYESLFGKGGEQDKQDDQIKKAQQWYTKDAESRQKAEENAHNAIQILIAKAEAQRVAAKEYEDRVNEQFYEKEKKRLYDLYQEQLKLKGKIGSLDNQRTIVSERSQGTITALSPKQEQLAKEYAQQLAKVNAEISRTASLVGYVDAQNAKESIRIALLEQEIKLQKELDKALEKIYAEQQKKTDAPNSGLSASQIKSMENEYARLLVQIDKVNAARREMNEKQGAAWSNGNMQAFAQISSGIQAAENELNRLNERKAQLENESQLQLDKIRDTHERKRGEQAVKDFEKAEKEKTQIAEREAKKRADEEKKKIQGYKSQNLAQNTSLVGAAEFANTANTINRLQTALKYLQDALSKTKPNTPEWNEANMVYQETKKRLEEIKKSMDGVKWQTNSIIPILKNLAMQIGLVFSVQQLNQWITHMVKVRAQFELQNIALRSLLQNKEKADQIFAEIQQLALKSPFSIMDLNKFTKEMAAYGVEADKLVGTTKMLADVSAGLGVDMGRLILAYGQVKTANYLRATEVRQFTEAGLNITQELADYFTELSGKMVTAGEVTGMITKRMVRFEDVAEVFKRVTSAGGMFYEMQEKQSEGLQGQIQRIGDAYSIMLNDIGKSNQGTIAGVLASVRELIQNWRVVAEYIKMAAGAYLLYESYVHRGTIIKAVTSLADAWKLVPKYIKASTAAEFIHTDAIGKEAMMLTGLGKLWSGATTAVRAFGIAMKAALNATIIGVIIYGVTELINYFVEAKAKADQLEESLDNIDKEVGKEFDQSAAAYERLARAITDSSKTFDERNEAMSELKRTFKDILPDEYLQLSYIEQYAGHWDEAEKSMKQYYDSLALEKEKAAIKDANESDLNEAREKIAKHANAKLGEDFGISRGQLESFVDNILQEMLDGSITTTKQAVDEYIRQIENWNDKTLSADMRGKIESDLTSTNFFADDNLNELLDIAKEMRKEYDELAESQSHYANDYEKAQAEADAMMKTQADGVKNLIERAKSGLDQINAIQNQLSQVDLEEQNEETQARKIQLQSQLNEAIQQERDLYTAMGIEMPESFEQVAATTIDIREETARASEEIIKMFGDGVNPAVVDLYQSYQQLERVQSQLNDGTQRSQEEVARLREIEARSIDGIKAKYRQMGVEVKGNIKGIASSQDTIRKEMIRVCDATREYFKKGLVDKLFRGIKTIGTTIEKFLGGLGIEVQFVDWDKLEAELKKNGGDLGDLLKDANTDVQKKLKANGQLIKNNLKINDEILKSAKGKLELQPGQDVEDYVKSLKTMYEENEKFISKYDKARDKKAWLKRWGKSEAEIQQLREQAKAAKEIAEAYDPTIFESKKTRSRSTKGTDNTEEIARKRFEFIKRANTEYEKLLKNYDAETAKAKILADMMGEARTLGVDKQFAKDLFTKASTLDTLQEVYDTFYKGIVAKYPKIAMDFQKTFNGIAIEIDVRLRESDRNNIKKQMDELMGGYELAIELDKSGVDRDIVSQLFGVETFDLSDVTDGIEKAWLDALNARAERAAKFAKTEFKAYKSLEEAKAAMGEEDVKLFESQQKKISDTFAKELRAREKEYAKYLKKSYSESVNEQVSAYRQLRQLQMDADFKREAIIGNDKIDENAKQTALQQIDSQSSQIAAKMQEKLQEKLNKIQWEGFKDSPLFETVLSDIENLSTRSIDMLLSKLEELKITFKDLDPKSIKEITKYIDQLTAQKITKNPFKEWGKALREIHKLRKEGLTLDKLNAKLISDSDELTRINAEIESYNKVLAIKQQMTHVTEDDSKLMQTNTQTLKRLLILLEGQKNQKSGAGLGTDGSEESKAIDLQIEKIQEILAARKTILASNGDNLVLSAQELALLKQQSGELTKQVGILEQNKTNKQGDINKTKGKITLWDKLTKSQNQSIAILNEVGTAASAGFSVAEEALSLFGDSSDEVTNAMKQGFDDCIQSCLSLVSAIIIMGKASNTALGVIGLIAAALTAVATVFKTIFNVHEARLEKSIKEHQRQLKKLEAEYDNLSDAISNSFSGFQLGTNTEASIQNLKKQNEQYRAMIEAERRKKKSDKDKIADWQQTIEDNYKKMQELRQEYLTELGGLGSGSDVKDAAEGFVDAWADAFGETRNGLSGLKEQFNEFLKNIIKKQAYMKIADHWINKFGDMINASFDKYGQVDYEKLMQAMQWFTEEAMPQMDTALEDMNAFWERLGINWTGTTSNLSGLAAGIQSITEETAQILEALLNSMRYYVADTNEQLRQIFVTMTNPNDENPFLKELKNQTKYLASIDKRLDSVISATKRASGSHINVFTA